MNFLRVRDLLIVPVFGMKGDERALGILRDVHPGFAVEAVECGELAERGRPDPLRDLAGSSA